MEEYLRLLSSGDLRLDDLPQERHPVDDASTAYAALNGERKPLLVLLSYPDDARLPSRTTRLRAVRSSTGRVRVALVGAGGFAQGAHLPNLGKLADRFEVRAVVSRTGSSAKAVAARAGAAYATTDLDEALADPEIDLVLISTRHDLHAEQTLAALRAGKHVFVEKPLAMRPEELDEIEAFYAERDGPLLMTGFNRRFSPPVVRMRELLAGRTEPLVADYRMNAGYIPLGHWVHGPEGGGRNIGEACHIYDVFDSLVGDAEVTAVTAQAIGTDGKRLAANDNFAATISYADGSICTLIYTALGHTDHAKERLEIFTQRQVISLDDYKALTVTGSERGWASKRQQKGHLEELEALARAIQQVGSWPIGLEEQIRAMRVAFAVEDAISRGENAS